MEQSEILRIQAYLRVKFNTEQLTLKKRKEVNDSVEVLMGGEFIGLIYKDEDDGEISYDFNMPILEIDLPKAA